MSGFSQLSSKLAPGEHGSELLLDAQAHIWNNIFNFINSMSLKCLTAVLPIHHTKARNIYRLMRILNHS
ncbi:trans-resveratrol di-O-methyltransferase-like [Fagus crenata]